MLMLDTVWEMDSKGQDRCRESSKVSVTIVNKNDDSDLH